MCRGAENQHMMSMQRALSHCTTRLTALRQRIPADPSASSRPTHSPLRAHFPSVPTGKVEGTDIEVVVRHRTVEPGLCLAMTQPAVLTNSPSLRLRSSSAVRTCCMRSSWRRYSIGCLPIVSPVPA
jgi:hypothetical protein